MRLEHELVRAAESNAKEMDCGRVCPFTFLRCVFEPSGVDSQYNPDHTVGGPSVPAVLQREDSPSNRGNSVFSAVLRAPEVVKGSVFRLI